MTVQTLLNVAIVVTLAAMMLMMLAPITAYAQFEVPDAGDTGLPEDDNVNDFILRIINILLGIVGLIAVLFLIIGGFRYVTAGGNEETAEAGKKTIINAVIGIVIVILAFVIVRVVATAFLG